MTSVFAPLDPHIKPLRNIKDFQKSQNGSFLLLKMAKIRSLKTSKASYGRAGGNPESFGF